MKGVTQTFFTARIPPIEFTSIWDFYRYIGWDYKTKRFTDGNG